MSFPEYENFDVPGVGEVRARKGTSTAELAGAVKFWHDKYQSARLDGFIGGSVFTLLVSLCGFGVFYLLTR